MAKTAHELWCDRTGDQQLWESLIRNLETLERRLPRLTKQAEVLSAAMSAATAARAIRQRIQSPELSLDLRTSLSASEMDSQRGHWH